jgi:hypothetical protein
MTREEGMNSEELTEREAEYLYARYDEGIEKWSVRIKYWRKEALAHFKMLNECGVRMLAPGVRYIEKAGGQEKADLAWIIPLPEKE